MSPAEGIEPRTLRTASRSEAAKSLHKPPGGSPAFATGGRSLSSPQDRRSAPRFACDGTAEVVVLGGALRFHGRVHDLSAKGCRLKTDIVFALERGTQVEIALTVNRVQFRVAGGVRSNSKVRGVGLEFMYISARCARFIEDLIGELEAKYQREL